MTSRRRLPNRRQAETFRFQVDSQHYIATIGRFPEDNAIAEVFINSSMRIGSTADVNAVDGALAVSLALQYGCPIDVLRAGMKRNADGTPQGPLGAVLDAIQPTGGQNDTSHGG